MGKVTHDLECRGCGKTKPDVRAERKPDGVHMDTPEGRDVLAVCDRCGERLDIALRPFAIGRGRSSSSDSAQPRMPDYLMDYRPQHTVGDPTEVADRGDGKPGMGIVDQVVLLGRRDTESVVAEIVVVRPDINSSDVLN